MSSKAIIAFLCVVSMSCTTEPQREKANVEGQEASKQVNTAKVDGDGRSLEGLAENLPVVRDRAMDAATATRLVKLSLDCVDREYPNKPSNVLAGDEEVVAPSKMHPAFYGCFDWHSAVHGHWAMVKVLKVSEELDLDEELAASLRRKLGEHLKPELIFGEIDYFKAEHHKLFERPYGWGWLFRLQGELITWEDEDASRWASALQPLVQLLRDRTIEYLSRLSVPLRAGTHHSTAYAMAHMHDYALAAGDEEFAAVLERESRKLYMDDTDCPVDYEPSGEDFISPCLAEADLMGRVLGPEEFSSWLDSFLPRADSDRFESLRSPPKVLDKRDPRIGHLIGLSLYRASAYRSIAFRLDSNDPRRSIFLRLGTLHLVDGLDQMAGSGYGGAHWLASFALHALTGTGPYGRGNGQPGDVKVD